MSAKRLSNGMRDRWPRMLPHFVGWLPAIFFARGDAPDPCEMRLGVQILIVWNYAHPTIELLRGEFYTRLGYLYYRRADDPRAFARDLLFSYALALAFHLIVLRPYFLDRLVCPGA